MKAISLEQGRLSEQMSQQYWRDGYLHPIPVLDQDAASQVRAQLEDIERDWLESDLRLPLNAYKRVNAHVVMPFVGEVARDSAVLDVVEGILGPDILIFAAEFFVKEPNTKHVVTMHQDLTYWGLGAIDGLVTAWIALSPATSASGCMDFVAGSHKNAILPHEDTFADDNLLSRGQEVAVDIAEGDKSSIELRPGEMSLHHGLTIHGSGPNTSDDRRIGLVVRYIRPDMKQQVGDKDYAMMARGEDRHGNFIHVPEPEENFSPDSLQLYDEIRDAQARVMMRGSAKSSDIYA
ncbi:MAG: phytanoyl-CoA dioxygenase family protein [Boseongicola sp.]